MKVLMEHHDINDYVLDTFWWDASKEIEKEKAIECLSERYGFDKESFKTFVEEQDLYDILIEQNEDEIAECIQNDDACQDMAEEEMYGLE